MEDGESENGADGDLEGWVDDGEEGGVGCGGVTREGPEGTGGGCAAGYC